MQFINNLFNPANTYKFNDYKLRIQEWNTVWKWDWIAIFDKEWAELQGILVSQGVKKDIISQRYTLLWEDFKSKAKNHKDHSDFRYQSPVALRTIYETDKVFINPLQTAKFDLDQST
jgi:hypothetical protein